MKRLCLSLILCLFVACGGGDGGGNGGGGDIPAGCSSTSISALSSVLGLSSSEQSIALAELNNTFRHYDLWHCVGTSSSNLDDYGDNFGDYYGPDSFFGYTFDWWESGNQGWGYSPIGGGEHIALGGSW